MAQKQAAARPKAEAKSQKPTSAVADDESFVRIRMYRHGLGDCFLISFRRDGEQGDPSFHILIDCGIIPGNPKAQKRICEVVTDIKDVTKGKIDVLVVTHEHADHVSGFNQARALFGEKAETDAFTFQQVWLAWTENPADKTANDIRAKRQEKLAALWMGLGEMDRKLTALGADEEARLDFDRAKEVLSFFGIDPSGAPPRTEGLGVAVQKVGDSQAEDSDGPIAEAMKWVQTRGETAAKFWSPGDVFPLEGVDQTRVFVLGPPKDLKQLHQDLPSASRSKEKETYEEKDKEDKDKTKDDGGSRSFGLAETGGARAFLAAAFGAVATDPNAPLDLENDRAIPFDRKYQIPQGSAEKIEFFQDHYFRNGALQQGQDWRRIDGEWAAGSAAFAMQLDSDTNNTSLALAFELPGGHVLLFPGDAQVGNWESWHADSKGEPTRFKDQQGNDLAVTAESLLNRVIFYKVGHHGSHNATLRDKGLEMMNRPGLTAAIPVDSYVAHVKKRWTKMPFNPLINRLAELTRDHGRVVQIDKNVPDDAKPVKSQGVTVTVVDSPTLFEDPFDVEGQDQKVKRPLYVDYRIKLG